MRRPGPQERILSAPRDALGYVLEHAWPDDEIFGFPYAGAIDVRVVVRAVLEAVDPDEGVVLDYTDLAEEGFCSEEDDLREIALQGLREEFVASEKLIVLTEGPTDAEVLQKTLEARYPHLQDYLAFPDFHGPNAEGGAGALARLVKYA